MPRQIQGKALACPAAGAEFFGANPKRVALIVYGASVDSYNLSFGADPTAEVHVSCRGWTAPLVLDKHLLGDALLGPINVAGIGGTVTVTLAQIFDT